MKPEVYCRVQNNPSLDLILNQSASPHRISLKSILILCSLIHANVYQVDITDNMQLRKSRLSYIIMMMIYQVSCSHWFTVSGGGGVRTHTHTHTDTWSQEHDVVTTRFIIKQGRCDKNVASRFHISSISHE